MKSSHKNGSCPLQDTQHHKQKHCTTRGNQNAAQQATSGEAGEATEEQTTDQYEVTALGQHSRQMLTVELTL